MAVCLTAGQQNIRNASAGLAKSASERQLASAKREQIRTMAGQAQDHDRTMAGQDDVRSGSRLVGILAGRDHGR